jgi:hypothetical protein
VRLPLRIRPAGQDRFDQTWELRLASGRGPSPEYLTLELPGVGLGDHTLHLILEPRGGAPVHQTLDLVVVGSSAGPQEGLEGGHRER